MEIVTLDITEKNGFRPETVELEGYYGARIRFSLDGEFQAKGLRMDKGKLDSDRNLLVLDHFHSDPLLEEALLEAIPTISDAIRAE